MSSRRTGAKTVATGCPFCMRMITEEAAKEEPDTAMEIMDVAEIDGQQSCQITCGDLVSIVLLIFLAAIASVTACEAQPRVAIATKAGREVVFQVEIADTPAKRAMGLQYRHELASDRGMIFLFAAESPQTFWMKNTPIPLDMVFINRERQDRWHRRTNGAVFTGFAIGGGSEPVRIGDQRRPGKKTRHPNRRPCAF